MYVCEHRGKHESVIHMLTQTSCQRLPADEVVLGALLEAATASSGWKRADELFHLLVSQHEAQPNFLAYTTYAEAHVLAGRPQNSVQIIDEMLTSNATRMDYKLAVEYLQALVLVYHSSLAATDLQKLTEFLMAGSKILESESASSGKEQWRQLTLEAEKLTPRLCLVLACLQHTRAFNRSQ